MNCDHLRVEWLTLRWCPKWSITINVTNRIESTVFNGEERKTNSYSISDISPHTEMNRRASVPTDIRDSQTCHSAHVNHALPNANIYMPNTGERTLFSNCPVAVSHVPRNQICSRTLNESKPMHVQFSFLFFFQFDDSPFFTGRSGTCGDWFK